MNASISALMTLMRRAKKLNAMTAGTAATSDTAVVPSASAMPGATVARFAEPLRPILVNALMTPTTTSEATHLTCRMSDTGAEKRTVALSESSAYSKVF